MKKMISKFLAMQLSMALLCGLCVPPASAAESRYRDIQGHWAEDAIERWSSYGVVGGYDGAFAPDAPITRGQMAVILANALGLSEITENPFRDVPEDAWYAPYILRCYAAGIMAGDDGRANPEAVITRQEAMVMLSQALGVAPAENAELSEFADRDQVAVWAAPFVAAMVRSGLMAGVGNGRLAPTGAMTRAAVVTVVDSAVIQYICRPGSYDLTDGDGIILVAAGNVTLSGKTAADILVTHAADGKTVTFDKAAVTGGITVQADNAEITAKSSKLPHILLTGAGSKVEKGKTSSGSGGGSGNSGGSTTPAYTNLTISASGQTVSSAVYQDVIIAETVEDGEVTLSGLTIRGDLYIYGGGSNSINLNDCMIWGRIIMAKVKGQAARLHLTNTPVSRVEVKTPAIIEAADAHSTVKVVEAEADVEVKGGSTVITTVRVPTAAGDVVEIKAAAGTVVRVEAKGRTSVTGAAGSIGSVVAEASVTVVSGVVDRVEVPAAAKDVTVEIQGDSAIVVETNANGTKLVSDGMGNVTVSGTAAESVVRHTHNWGEGEVTKQPTCAEEGVKTYICTAADCPSGTRTEALAKIGHTPVTDGAVAADCLTPGRTEGSHCSVCGEVLSRQEEVAPLGHDYADEFTVDEAATCTQAGSQSRHCTRCEAAADVTEIPAVAHSYGDWDYADAENHQRACAVCQTVERQPHSWDAGSGEDVKTYTCSVCKGTKTEQGTVSSRDVWFTQEGSGDYACYYLNWTPVELAEGESYYVNGQSASDAKWAVFALYKLPFDVTDLSFTIEKGTYKQRTTLYTTGDILKTESLPSVDYTVKGQADGSYLLNHTADASGMNYYIRVKGADGTEYLKKCYTDNKVNFYPWDGCAVEVTMGALVISEDGTTLTFRHTPAEVLTDFQRIEGSQEVQTVTTSSELQAALERGGIIELGADIASGSSSITVYGGDPATLRLNGKTLTLRLLSIQNGKELTVDGTAAGSQIVCPLRVQYGAQMTVTGGTYQQINAAQARDISVTDAVVTGAVPAAIQISNSGHVTLQNCQVTVKTYAGVNLSRCKAAAVIGGNYTCASASYDALKIDYTPTITLTDVTADSVGGYAAAVGYADDLTVAGGSYTSASAAKSALYVFGSKTASISGGEAEALTVRGVKTALEAYGNTELAVTDVNAGAPEGGACTGSLVKISACKYAALTRVTGVGGLNALSAGAECLTITDCVFTADEAQDETCGMKVSSDTTLGSGATLSVSGTTASGSQGMNIFRYDSVELVDCTAAKNTPDILYYSITAQECGKVTVTGGEISGDMCLGNHGMHDSAYELDSVKLTGCLQVDGITSGGTDAKTAAVLRNCEFANQEEAGVMVQASNGAQITVESGTYEGLAGYILSTDVNQDGGSSIIVRGGSFRNTGNPANVFQTGCAGYQIQGGVFGCDPSEYVDLEHYTVSGGSESGWMITAKAAE